MNIKTATKDYERWMGTHIAPVKQDLLLKHRRMKADRFEFLRSTYYRWAQVFPEQCAALQNAPEILAVGDLHVENFGTWRDAEGRLVWGVNDFDEACFLPYTNDLVRLATTIRMAGKAGHLAISDASACEELLAGYTEGLTSGGKPFVLAEEHPTLRALAMGRLKDPHQFWRRMRSEAKSPRKAGSDVRKGIEALLPESCLKVEMFGRVAGRGSLGRPRLVALVQWAGGTIAREAKALLPSASLWARGKSGTHSDYATILAHSVRCPDPFVRILDQWILRRLAPDCTRIELAELGTADSLIHLIRAMGFETANIHLGTKGAAAAILKDLKRRSEDWLMEASRTMGRATREDWDEWRA